MADSLTDLQNTAGQTLGGVTGNTGVTPTSIATAQSLGASQNSSQMVGTPQQTKAALKESLSPKNSLSELMRTASGRVAAKQGQSEEALQNVESAKALSGLAGKLGAATTQAVANAKLPLDVSANLDSVPADKRGAVSAATSELLDAISKGGDVMSSYKKLKEAGYNSEQIAGFFNVSPDVLWGKVESALPANIKVADLAGVADEGQLNTVRNMLPEGEREGFDQLSWAEAKQVINQKLNDSMTNVNALKRQASDRTLPQSTRALAVQRLRELGMTGEFQAAQEIEDAKSVVEDADNLYIDGQAYEVGDVLRSPEAKALISDILMGNKDISALKGTPFEGLTDLISQRSEKLGEYFGLSKGQLEAGAGKLAAVETQRKSNEEAMTNFFSTNGLTPTTDTNVLKALGITEDMQKGYAAFDQNIVNTNPVLKTVLGLNPTSRASALNVLALPGADGVINRSSQIMLDLLVNDPVTAGNLIKTSNIVKDASQIDTAEEMNNVWKEMGVDLDTISSLSQLSSVNVKDYGITLPAELDSNKDGVVDGPAQLAQNLQGKTPEQIKAVMDNLNNANLSDIATAHKYKTDYVAPALSVLTSPGIGNHWEDNRHSQIGTVLAKLESSPLLSRDGAGNIIVNPNVPAASKAVAEDALMRARKLREVFNTNTAARAKDAGFTQVIAQPAVYASKHGVTEGTLSKMAQFEDVIRNTKNPELRKQALAKFKEAADYLTVAATRGNDSMMSKTQHKIFWNGGGTDALKNRLATLEFLVR